MILEETSKQYLSSDEITQARKAVTERMDRLHSDLKAFRHTVGRNEAKVLNAMPSGFKGYNEIIESIHTIENVLSLWSSDMMNEQTWNQNALVQDDTEQAVC